MTGVERTDGKAAAGTGIACAPGRKAVNGRARIAIMLPRFSRYGGVEQFGYRLSEGLVARGYAVDFICARREIAPPDGVRVLAVGRPGGSRFLKMLWFLLRAEMLRRNGGYDLSISLGKTWNQDLSRMGGGPLKIFWQKSERALKPGLPRLAKRLGRWLKPSNWLTLALERRQFGRDREVVAVSHLVRQWLLQAHPVLNPERVNVVYNRPDPARFFPPAEEVRQQARANLKKRWPGSKLVEEPFFVGTASTNFELKGLAPLIRALSLMHPGAVLFVAGGREHEAYAKLARHLEVADRVVFCGKIDDMPEFYQALDLFILPTFYDACSNAVLEAKACGCRVLTSDSNGAAFFLDEGDVFPDPGDADELARRMTASAARPAPGPFYWPETVRSGLDDFMDVVDQAVRTKEALRGKSE